MIAEYYDSVVIGAGINGSWTALQLARKGQKTMLVEQFPIPHSRGSSGGQTRITRLANSGIRALTPIMAESYKQWKDLQKKTKNDIIRFSPMFVISNRSNRTEIDRMEQSIIECQETPVWWEAKTFNEKYGTTYPDDHLILEDPAAGILMADKCLLTVQNEFKSLGGTIADEFPIQSIKSENESTVTVSGAKGSMVSSSLVICAGPWTKEILRKLGVDLPLSVCKIGVYYWSFKNGSKSTFTFIDNSCYDGNHVYGLPEMEYPNLVKICYHDGPDTNPDERELSDISSERNKIVTYVKNRLPFLNPGSPAIEESCLYTKSPDREMIIDRVPAYPNILFAAGFSGSGFKTAPVVGEILADMAMKNEPRFDIGDFSYNRFNKPKSML